MVRGTRRLVATPSKIDDATSGRDRRRVRSMTTWKGSVLVIAALGASMAGCMVRGRAQATVPTAEVRVQAPPPPSVRASISVRPPTVANGVTVVSHQCQAGSAEQFNGFDDNCDGRIDE